MPYTSGHLLFLNLLTVATTSAGDGQIALITISCYCHITYIIMKIR